MLKVKVTWIFWMFCVHSTAATRGQYSALNKTCECCLFF